MIEVSQRSDGTVRYLNPIDLNPDMILGGQAVPDGGANPRYISDNAIKLTIQPSAAAGGLASWQNTFPYAIIVTGTLIDITVAGGAASTVSIGQGNSGTTLFSNLISGQAATAIGVFGNQTAFLKVPAGNFITASLAAGTLGSLAGGIYIFIIPAT